MSPTERNRRPAPEEASRGVAREAWEIMSDLVLDHERRRQATAALDLSFSRVRAIRRLARRSMSMNQLANLLDIEPANATPVVDDLEERGLVRRRPHPTDRRARLVEATLKGRQAAQKADEILLTPPPGLTALDPGELDDLLRVLRRVG